MSKFRNSLPVTLLVGILTLFLLITKSFGGKDDSDSEEEQCYPGKNCIPGCYCSGGDCRPYFKPKSPQHGEWKCGGYSYPKWKLEKKGSKSKNKLGVYASLADIRTHIYKKSESFYNGTTTESEKQLSLSATSSTTASYQEKRAFSVTAALNDTNVTSTQTQQTPSSQVSITTSQPPPLLRKLIKPE